MSTFTYHIILFVALFLMINNLSSLNAQTVNSKSSATLYVEGGVYSVSFSSYSCKLTMGVITSVKYSDLSKLPYSIPSTFTVLKQDSTYGDTYSYSVSESSYFVLFNNGTTSCSYSKFTPTIEVSTLSSSPSLTTLPYGITKSFTTTFSNPTLVIRSQSSSSFSFGYYLDSTYSTPTSTPSSSAFSSRTLSGYGTTSIALPTSSYYSYVYLNCRTLSGCPVYLSIETTNNNNDSGSSAIIGAVIGPIVFVAIFTFIVIITIISTILARRRRLLLLAAATSAATTTTYSTQPNYVPVPTAVATTTTEQTTVFVPQNTAVPQPYTTQPQPYANQPQPYVTQPQPYYGNQAYYSQPVTSQPQPYQPMAYQPQNPYYNPGVGAYPTNVTTTQQEPMPAFNPNVDRV